MKAKPLLGLVALVGMAGAIVVYSQSASLTRSCEVCAVGDTVVFTGSGFHKSKDNPVPTMILWGSTDETNCVTDKKGNFECTVTLNSGPGVYNAVVYDKADITANGVTVLGATNVIVQ